jgi:predicted HD phosphohydrolase
MLLSCCDPATFATSRESLNVQGGPMSPAEVQAFQANPNAPAAIELRRWDEAAKDPTTAMPTFEHFRPALQRLIETHLLCRAT